MAAEAVIILGCRTNPDGTASDMMKYRVYQGAKVYHSLVTPHTPHPWVIVTGYQAPGNQVITEAKAMFNLIQEDNLIPVEHVIVEEKATNTEGNAYWSRIVVDDLGVQQVHVVTTEPHLQRSKCIFEKIYPLEAYKVQYHSSTQQLDEDTKKERDQHEEEQFKYMDQNIAAIPLGIKVSPDGKKISLLNSPVISKIFNHGFTTRFGGVSTYRTLSSLNLMYNPKRRDPRANVSENRQRLARECGFNILEFYMAKCVHGARVWVVGDPEPDSYDALVTQDPNVTIAAPGADCSILLFCDPVQKIFGAAHSGWRGTLAQISHAVLDVMTERFSCNVKSIRVAVGPTIGPCCFEVGEDVADQFAAISTEVVIRKQNKPKPFVDLRKTTRLLLEKYGVLPENIDDSSRERDEIDQSQRVTQCTFCDPQQRFFSYRRDGSQYGTQIGWITMKPEQ